MVVERGKAMFIKLAQSVFAAALFAAVLTFSASAAGKGHENDGTVGAPGPVAGVGLMSVAVVGGYIWFLRRNRQGKVKKRPE